LKPPQEEIHLWRLLLDELPGDCSSLAADEQLRADKLVAAQHRHRFIAMRSALRSLLGTYLQLSPGSVVFVYGEKGKPSLTADLNRLDLRFNVSHSGGIGLIAVATGVEIGVDVETRGDVFDFMAIARRFFSEREHKALAGIPDDLRQRAFLRCWARKESYVKAIGKGLACSLQSFSVSVSPQICEDVLLESGSVRKHHVGDVLLPDDCCAALAIEGSDRPRSCWTYP
jgi:4'-phosphopantetheinyl transferase